jgi:hypothetical protein
MRLLRAAAGSVGAAGALLCIACSQSTSSSTSRAITRADEALAAAASLEVACQNVLGSVPVAFVAPYQVQGAAGSASVGGSKTAHDNTWSGADWGELNDTTAALNITYQSFGTSRDFTASGTASCRHFGRNYYDCGGTPPYTHGCWGGYSGADTLGSQDLAVDFVYEGARYHDDLWFSLGRTLPLGNSSSYPYGSTPYTGTLGTSAGLSFTFP